MNADFWWHKSAKRIVLVRRVNRQSMTEDEIHGNYRPEFIGTFLYSVLHRQMDGENVLTHSFLTLQCLIETTRPCDLAFGRISKRLVA